MVGFLVVGVLDQHRMSVRSHYMFTLCTLFCWRVAYNNRWLSLSWNPCEYQNLQVFKSADSGPPHPLNLTKDDLPGNQKLHLFGWNTRSEAYRGCGWSRMAFAGLRIPSRCSRWLTIPKISLAYTRYKCKIYTFNRKFKMQNIKSKDALSLQLFRKYFWP